MARVRPYAFLRIADRWINMALVTDIEDHEDSLVLFMATDMARRVGREDPKALDVARQYTVSDPEAIQKLRSWLLLNDED